MRTEDDIRDWNKDPRISGRDEVNGEKAEQRRECHGRAARNGDRESSARVEFLKKRADYLWLMRLQ